MVNKRPLYVYVIAAAVVWAIILGIVQFSGNAAHIHTFASVCGGFWIGMLAMYAAVHVYKWK